MFPTLKPTFGTPANNTSFGFSSNPAPNPFGQSFGKPATTGFGTQSTAFGSSATPLFGSSSQHGSLFAAATPTPSFGQPATTQPAFGSAVFGTTAAQPSGSGLFGASNTSAFGQQNKSSGFGFGTSSGTTGFFGQPTAQVAPQPQNTGLFGQTQSSSMFGSTGFGQSSTATQGTVIKFSPVTGTDTMVKGSINQTISTRHHCITCMKEYENKSLEELRWEDYQANRKGPQQGSQVAAGLFGGMAQPVGGGLFGSNAVSTTTNTLFGQNDANKSVFGTSAPAAVGFGQPTTGFGATAQTSSTGLFGKPLAGFGTNATSTSTFPFNSTAQTNTLFGGNTQAKPFGATPQPSTLFGQSSSGFGTQSSFGSFGTPANQNVGLFNQNKTTPFNMGTTTGASAGFGTFGQPAAQNTGTLFQGAKTSTAFGGFGTTTSTAPAFGQSAFGQSNQLFSSTFNKPAAPLFGQATSTTNLGGGLSMGGSTLFGATQNKPMFGTNTGMFNTGFGNTSFNTPFNMGGQNQPAGVSTTDQNQINTEQQMLSLTASPFGLATHLNNVPDVDQDIKDLIRPTNPGELNALLTSVHKSPPSYTTDKLQPVQLAGRKIGMYDGLEQKDETIVYGFGANRNPKRLVLRHRNNEPEEHISDIIKNVEYKAAPEDSSTLTSAPSESQSDMSISAVNPDLEIESGLRPLNTHLDTDKTTVLKDNQQLSNTIVSPGFSKSNRGSHTSLSTDLSIMSVSAPVFTSTRVNGNDDDSDGGEIFTEACDSQEWSESNNTTATLSVAKASSPANTSDSLHWQDEGEDDGDIPSAEVEHEQLNPHPTGIVLTRPEYYTVPPLDDLIKYIGEDGSCVVQGFTIGRYGYGSVFFPDAFDVSNLNLDELVHFRHKEITIYPDESMKPPQGQGLNRRAQVTLDKVWPFDKNTNRPIFDSETLAKMDYAGRLRRLCERKHTPYIDYRPDTGSWVFKVHHFSKYGLRESDDEDEDVEMLPVSSLQGQTLAAGVRPVATLTTSNGLSKVSSATAVSSPAALTFGLRDIVESPLYHYEMHNESFSGESSALNYRSSMFDDIDFEASGSGICLSDTSKCAIMKSTFFLKELDYDDAATVSDTASSEMGVMEISEYVSKSSPIREIEDEPTYYLEFMQDEEDDDMSDTTEPRCIQLEAINGLVPMTESYVSEYNIADIAAFKGRSFKVGWTRDMSLIILSSRAVTGDVPDDAVAQDLLDERFLTDFSPTVVDIVTINQHYSVNDTFKESTEKHLMCVLKNSTVNYIDEVPIFRPMSGTGMLEGHHEITLQLSPMDYNKQVWDLCQTLWGYIYTNGRQSEERKIRKMQFSKWLKKVVRESVNNEIVHSDNKESTMFLNILAYVSGNRLQEASALAMNCYNRYIALLLSQLPSSVHARSSMKKQLAVWELSSVNNLMDVTLLKLYSLIAGEPVIMHDSSAIHVSENMDWFRSLGLYVWYIVESAKPLSTAVSVFEQAFLSNQQVAKPDPVHYAPDTYDLRYLLLKFYSDTRYSLQPALNPDTHTPDSLDYSLSWLLMQTFTSLGSANADIPESVKIHIHTSFAAQLEQLDLWHWAVFVLLFIGDVNTSRTQILDIIGRHVELMDEASEDYRNREQMLVDEFKVPSEWIDGAKANLALLREQYKEAVYYLLYSKQWSRAHDVIIEHFVPEHFLGHDYDYLISLLSPISAYGDTLDNWNNSGGLVLEFAKVAVAYKCAMEPSVSDMCRDYDALYKIEQNIKSLHYRYGKLPRLSYLHEVCVSEMATRLATMLRELHNVCCFSNIPHTDDSSMPPDYVKQEMNTSLEEHMKLLQEEVQPRREYTYTKMF